MDSDRRPLVERAGRLLYAFRGFIPLPVFAVAFLAAAPSPLSFLAGVAVAAAGESVRLWALTYIGPKSRAERKTRASRLIREGPYSLARNPLYLANICISAGVLLAANRPWFLVLAPLMLIYYIVVSKAEEGFLKQAFPGEAEAYLREVRAFLPAFRKPAPAAERFPMSECIFPEISTIVAIELCLSAVGSKLFFEVPVWLDLGDRLFTV